MIVSVEQPHTSARNSWPAIVVGLTLLTDRVRIDLEGEPGGHNGRHTDRCLRARADLRQQGVADSQGDGSGGLRRRRSNGLMEVCPRPIGDPPFSGLALVASQLRVRWFEGAGYSE